jgi:N-acylneuraminate cytidylyltransferase
LFDEVMVSTDDAEIADIAQKYGAQVPFMRQPETATDHATTAAVIAEVVAGYGQRKQNFEHLCCLYPATPLLTEAHLKAGFHRLQEGAFDTVFAAVPFESSIWRAFQAGPNQSMNLIWPENALKRTQDLPAAYHDAGQFYWLNARAFQATNSIFGARTAAVILSPNEVQDIDTEADWQLAEFKARHHGR